MSPQKQTIDEETAPQESGTAEQQPHSLGSGPTPSDAGPVPTGGLTHPGGTVLAFEIAGQRYGMPVGNVVQIVEMVALSRLPAAPRFIAGVIDYRGQVIPLVDMRCRFGEPTLPYGLRTPIVVSQLNGRTVGLVVDGVSEVVNLRPEQIESAAQIVGEEIVPQTHYLAAVARLDDGLLLLLDPATLFTTEEAKAVAGMSSRQ